MSLSEDRKATLLRRAERAYALAEANGEKRMGRILHHAFNQLAEDNNPAYLLALQRMKRVPVTLDEFVDSPEFLAGHMEVWPSLMTDLRAMNPDQLVGETAINEILLGGATGTGKTALSTITQAYQLYYLSCFDGPQLLFGLSRATPIVFMFASVSSTVTNRVIYKPFRDLFTGMKHTQKYIEYNKQLESSLVLAANIVVVPALASVQSMVGQAVISGILDEVNFMARVENSKQVLGPQGTGGVFDQAELAYRNLSRRRKSRFVTRGPQPGALCVVSSTRYRGDFLDRRIEEVIKYGESNTLVFRRKQYEVVPQERFVGPKFKLLVGTDRWPTRVLSEEDYHHRRFPPNAEIEDVPVEYLPDFQKDAENALRDICGIATDAIRPFIAQRDKIMDCINAARVARLRTIYDREEVVLAHEELPPPPPKFKPQDKDAPRFVHIDLATTHDRCGVAMLRHDGYVTVRNERLPRFSVEMALGIKPDPLHELEIAKLREWLLRLMQELELNVVQISYDGFNSKESIQVLRRAGIRATYVSVDRTPEPYEVFRQAIYDERVLLPESELLRQELIQLEWFAHKGKVDHPARGAKDVADAVCGALYAASRHPVVKTGVRAYTPEGEPVRSPYTMQRPTAKYRPSAKTRPAPGRERLRQRDLAPGEPLPEDEIGAEVDASDQSAPPDHSAEEGTP